MRLRDVKSPLAVIDGLGELAALGMSKREHSGRRRFGCTTTIGEPTFDAPSRPAPPCGNGKP
jgi:hypothetical protein